MAKIYLLTSGEYSDYHVHSVHSSLEQLEAVKKKLEDSDAYRQFNEPEEYELDEYGKDGRWPYTVHIQGPEVRCHIEHSSYCRQRNFVYHNNYPRNNPHIHYWTMVLAENEEHAIKIASDLIAQYKALNNLGE